MSRKHMPASPRNPSYLISLWTQQTNALQKLSVSDFEDPAIARVRFDFEASEALQVAAMRPTLEALAPHPRVLSRAMTSRSANAVALVLEVHGAEPYVHDPNLPFADVIRAGNLPMLRVLARHGFSFGAHKERLCLQALRRDDPSYYRFFRDELQMTGGILDITRPGNALTAPPSWVCEELVKELRCACPEGPVMVDVAASARGYRKLGTLRHLAILIACGLDLSQDEMLRTSFSDRPDIQSLIELTGTRHGALKLHQIEPALSSILMRPAAAAFYGAPLYAAPERQV